MNGRIFEHGAAGSRAAASICLRAAGTAALLAMTLAVARAQGFGFLPQLVDSSTMPANGDENPYGVAFVPRGFPSGGALSPGDVLVSNFNNGSNLQGEGTTVIQLTPTGTIAPPGAAAVFFTSTLPGLSTALGILRAGYVIVGNVPTTDGTSATIGQGALQVLDKNGNVVATWTDPQTLDGPWDLAIDDDGSRALIFVSNVLNGTVSRINVSITSAGPAVQSKTTIATGYTHVPNSAALILGPTGLAYDEASDTLYVASTNDNAIFAVRNAGTRTIPVTQGNTVFAGPQLRGPLALSFAPNGDLLAANGDAVNADATHPSEIVEFTRNGRFVTEYDVDTLQGGAFGLAVRDASFSQFNFAAVDDISNSLSVFSLPSF